MLRAWLRLGLMNLLWRNLHDCLISLLKGNHSSARGKANADPNLELCWVMWEAENNTGYW